MKNGAQDNSAVVILDHITLRVRDQFLFLDTSWELKENQQWAILGPNGAGKSTLAGAIAGDIPVVGGRILYPAITKPQDEIAYISFETQRQVIEREEARDESRYFSGNFDNMTTVYQMLERNCPSNPAQIESEDLRSLERLGLSGLMKHPIRYLSTGQMRKVLIARALLNSPKILILDEPFDGLDMQSREQLRQEITRLRRVGTQIILITHRLSEIDAGVSHILGVKSGQILFQGPRDKILHSPRVRDLYTSSQTDFFKEPSLSVARRPLELSSNQVLIELRHVSICYGNEIVLEDLSWKMRDGENWAIIGPNGSGKTTLLSLITGDHPQAYSNEIYIFGRRRGTGESVWEIKRYMGQISAEFHNRYRKSISASDVVLSGFFDSIGLYHRTTEHQNHIAREWMRMLGIEHKASSRFDTLSFGEQRRVLLARAVVKSPRLLILDEPCQGLDPPSRKQMLDLIDIIGSRTATNILFVTHHLQEWPTCITHCLRLVKNEMGNYVAISKSYI